MTSSLLWRAQYHVTWRVARWHEAFLAWCGRCVPRWLAYRVLIRCTAQVSTTTHAGVAVPDITACDVIAAFGR